MIKVTPLVHSADICPAMINSTDHMAISLELLIAPERGPGYWKLNAAYLEDDEYCIFMCNVIDQCSNLNIESSQTKWEICKLEIKTASIKYTKSKSKQRSNRLQSLEEQISKLNSKHNLSVDEQITLAEIENEVERMYDFKTTGAQIRSRVQLLEEGEKNSKCFMNLEKSSKITS